MIGLSEHFNYKKLLKFTVPSVVMMIFTSIYGVVDGVFVSNFVGKTPFAAINLIMPYLMIFGAVGFMIGTGGSALVAKTLGEGDKEKANRIFSMLIYLTVLFGVITSVVSLIFLRPVAAFFGAEGAMLEDCVTYGAILLPFNTFFMLQNTFQSFLVTAERPRFGLFITVAAGVTNIVLDALFVAVFDWGLAGAAVATAISQLGGGGTALLYFIFPNHCPLSLGKAGFDGAALFKTCTNGSSELMTNLSLSLVNMLYNFQLMRLVGEDGVAAYGVIMYVNFIFISTYIGYSIGVAPIIGFHYGADNREELKSLRKKSLVIIAIGSLIMTAVAELLAYPLSYLFVGYDEALLSMTVRAFMMYSLAFLLMGFNIFASAGFTALNNGLVSAIISFLRTLLFQVAAVMVLPLFFDIDGVWTAIVAAELLALFVSVFCYGKMKGKYGY